MDKRKKKTETLFVLATWFHNNFLTEKPSVHVMYN